MEEQGARPLPMMSVPLEPISPSKVSSSVETSARAWVWMCVGACTPLLSKDAMEQASSRTC